MSGKPVRTQTLAALQHANRIRMERVQDKQRIGTAPTRAGAFELCAAILEDPPAHWAKATAFELLICVDRIGRHAALSWLRKAGVQEGRYLSELTERQRFALAALLREAEGRRVAA